MDRYIIGIRREARDRVPPDWLEALAGIDGLTVVGAANPARVQVVASKQAIECARQLCAGYCHIESAIEHRPLGASGQGPIG
jgi:hypothetical protein